MHVILLSGGIDSALNLALAARRSTAALALTMRYGQRAQDAELRASQSLCKHYRVDWLSVDLSWLGEINPTSLTRSESFLPKLAYDELDHPELTQKSAKAVWVANRNGLFLNVAAAFAEARGLESVLVGFNREEAATFPDNSVAFLQTIEKSFSYSTLNKVKADSFTKDWDKTEILAKALELDLPLDLVWSCYQPGPERCWECESCKRTERALLAAGEQGRHWLARLGRKL